MQDLLNLDGPKPAWPQISIRPLKQKFPLFNQIHQIKLKNRVFVFCYKFLCELY